MWYYRKTENFKQEDGYNKMTLVRKLYISKSAIK